MLSAVKLVQRVPIEKLTEVALFADHMLTRSNEHSTRTKDAIHLKTRKLEIAGMMEDSPSKDKIEGTVGKGQTFGKFLNHIDRQCGFHRQRADRAGANDCARIWLDRRDFKSFFRKRIACDPAPGANVKRFASPAAQ